jgi:hypothetical protein
MKIMKKSLFISRFAAAALALLTLAGCDPDRFSQIVDIDIPPHQSRLVLNARFAATDTILSALVSNSLGILDEAEYRRMEDATVRLFYEGQLFQELQYDPASVKFIAALSQGLGAGPGLYRLEAMAPGYDPVFAEQRMPRAVAIESLRVEKDGAIDDEGRKADGVKVQFSDPAGEENYYALELIYEALNIQPNGDTSILFYYPLYASTLDQIVQSGNEFQQLFTDKSFDGNRYTLNLYLYSGNIDFEYPNGRLRARLLSLSRSSYLYDLSLQQYFDTVDNPFAEPVTVHSNINGGYGIFGLRTAAEAVVMLR